MLSTIRAAGGESRIIPETSPMSTPELSASPASNALQNRSSSTVDNLLHLLLAPMPLGNKAVVQDPNHEFRVGPVALPGHIDRPRLHRGIAVGTDDRLTKTFRRFGLFARDETRPD